jgi:hypothetical protein
MFASHCGYLTSLMNLTSNNLCTLAFTNSIFSSDILRSFCILGFACWLTCNLCSITSRVTPTRSEVDYAKTFLFLSRNCRSSACSCGLISVPMQTALSGTLGLSATLLMSPSASIAFLNSVEISLIDTGCSCSCCYVSSLKKYTFLWPGAKPRSIFLASFWLSKTINMPKVVGTLRQRYPECRAASKVFNRHHPNMVL